MMGFVPADEPARQRILTSLQETLFVEAGAGTGKTTSLVGRIVALVRTEQTTLDRIAAITFTTAAAAELRERVRGAFERAVATADTLEAERAACHRALADIDQAAIQTLDSFAARILRERPLEAGLPPTFEILDPLQAGILFQEQWERWIDAALDDPALTPAFRLAFSMGVTLAHLPALARALHEHYDLTAAADFPTPAPLPAVTCVASLVQAADEMDRLCTFARNGESDPLVAHVRMVQGIGRRLATMDTTSAAFWRVLSRSPNIKTNRGAQRDWQNADGKNACQTLKALLNELHDAVQADLQAQRRNVLANVLLALRSFVLDYAAMRRQHGRVEFMDLLICTRDLLRDQLDVRDYFRLRFTHLLIDEAQDTDPLQAEIALFLAEAVSPEASDEERPRSWLQVMPAPGKLFVVGDPKQSIYRFRRADVALTVRFRERMVAEALPLVQNFRSVGPIIQWVNQVFTNWMMEGTGQVSYTALSHRWEPSTDHIVRPGVHRLGDALPDVDSIGEVRAIEALGVAALMQRVRGEGWPVLDSEATARIGVEQFRPATARDICLLTPRRTGLQTVLAALEQADIPYRLESASLIFDTEEVRDVIACLRAIDDPADPVALVAALRSPAFAVSDVDLLVHVEAGGRLDYLSEGERPAGTVSDALVVLRAFHERSRWCAPVALLEEFLRDRRLFELALASRRPRERWRRYQWLLEAMRHFTEAGGGHLRAFLSWAAEQADEELQVVEAPIPDSDEDAVRIMTIHAAKGLEFPVVVLVGLNQTRAASSSPGVLFDREHGRLAARLGSATAGFETEGFADMLQTERAMDEQESIRLLYVATTRARDHLAVSVYRTAKDTKSAAAQIAAHLTGADHLWTPVDIGVPGTDVPELQGAETMTATSVGSQERRDWQDMRERRIAESARPPAVAATTLAQVMKDVQDDDSEEQPWRRGRGGAPLGRAVHAVLQTVDLTSGADLEAMAHVQSMAEGIPNREGDIVRLVRGALDSTVVRRAVASGRLVREAPVAAPVNSELDVCRWPG